VLQHHDQIVTGQDVGLSARCSYSLQNSTVGHGVQLQVGGDPGNGPAPQQETTYVVSPTVTMRITDRHGEDIQTAQVGDALSLRFHILDQHTPYQIFVRELVALDGVDSSEILLIDSLGCPTDPTIMGAISTVDNNDGAQILQAPFDAFKFPTSDVVQFKALVTPCLPKCEPVVCDVEDYYGMVRRVDSYGRRKRRRRSNAPTNKNISKDEEMLLVQSIRIADKFQFDDEAMRKRRPFDPESAASAADDIKASFQKPCVTMATLLLAAAVFLATQVALAGAWIYFWQSPRREADRIRALPAAAAAAAAAAYHGHTLRSHHGQHWQRFYHSP